MRPPPIPYQDNPTLVFQFIATEYLKIFNLLKQLRLYVKQKDIEQVHQILYQLNGPLEDQFHLFYNSHEDGHLSKFCHCSFYLANIDPNENSIEHKINKLAQQLYNLTHQALVLCMEAEPSKPNKTLQAIEQVYIKMQTCLQKAGQLITKMIEQFEDDESVLFFLLRHQEEFNSVYYPQYIKELFKKMYPNGIKDVEQYIIKQYTSRGFKQLVPEISKLALNLQKKKF